MRVDNLVDRNVTLINPALETYHANLEGDAMSTRDHTAIRQRLRQLFNYTLVRGDSLPDDLTYYEYTIDNPMRQYDDNYTTFKLVIFSRSQQVATDKCFSFTENPRFALKQDEYIARVVAPGFNSIFGQPPLYDTDGSPYYNFQKVCIASPETSRETDSERYVKTSLQRRLNLLRKIKSVPRIKAALGSWQQDAAQRAYAPSGEGYKEAKRRFEETSIAQAEKAFAPGGEGYKRAKRSFEMQRNKF